MDGYPRLIIMKNLSSSDAKMMRTYYANVCERVVKEDVFH